jgi:hypothetical protein
MNAAIPELGPRRVSTAVQSNPVGVSTGLMQYLCCGALFTHQTIINGFGSNARRVWQRSIESCVMER